MTRRYLLDTHIWLWIHGAPEKLPENIVHLIMKKDFDELYLSIISIWEICKLEEKGRLNLAVPARKWMDYANKSLPVNMVDITPDIACASCSLPGNFHKDPADQIIVATAREMGIPILTMDKRIIDYPYVQAFYGNLF